MLFKNRREKTLYEIFLLNQRKDIKKWHHYFSVYEKFLSPYRDRPVRILEIGVFRGGSMRMWREYFGKAALIYGIDIDPECARLVNPADATQIFIGSQTDRDFLRNIKTEIGEFDIVIDDGGHTARQQITSFEELYPATRGIYLVEDTHTSYWPEFMDMGDTTFMSFAKDKLDSLYEWHSDRGNYELHGIPPEERASAPPVSDFCQNTLGVHFYDSMVVFEKGLNEPRWHENRWLHCSAWLQFAPPPVSIRVRYKLDDIFKAVPPGMPRQRDRARFSGTRGGIRCRRQQCLQPLGKGLQVPQGVKRDGPIVSVEW